MNAVRRNQLICLGAAAVMGIVGYRGLTKPVKAEPGTEMAARFLAAKYVGMTQGVDPVHVRSAPGIQADRAVVKAEFGTHQECTVKMVRSDAEKEYGWLVEAIACGPAA